MKLNKPTIKPGTIILVRKSGLLPAGIRFFMRIYGRRKVKYNHSELVTYPNFVIGAVGKGVRHRPIKYAVRCGKWKEWLILEPIKPLTKEERGIMYKMISYYLDTPYQIMNFIQWILYIRYGFWVGKSSDKKMYCYELTARIWEFIRPGTFTHNLEITSIWNFIDNKNFKINQQ